MLRCAAGLLMVIALGAAPAASARVRPLEHRPVLKALGIPPLSAVKLRPVFRTGFERDSDLAGFYATPQSPLTRHEVRRGSAHRGERAHVGWLTGVAGTEPVDGPNHRGYPTIQLQRRPRVRAPRRASFSSGRASTASSSVRANGSAWRRSPLTAPTAGRA